MMNAELILKMNIANQEENFLPSDCNIKIVLFPTGFTFAVVLKRNNFSLIVRTAVSLVKLNALQASI